jgi:large repetitive protein
MTGGSLQRRLAALAVLVLLGLLVPSAASAAPALDITQPEPGASVNDATPGFAGTAADTSDVVILRIHEGNDTGGNLVQSDEALPSPFEETWETTASAELPDGVYTVVAQQVNSLLETTESDPVTFTVDTHAPEVSLDPISSPTRDSTPTLKGELGGASGDIQAVTVRIFEGAGVGGTLAAKGSATVGSGEWAYTPPSLTDGTYTAQASQLDSAGNPGTSTPVSFTVDTQAPTPTLDAVTSPSNDSTPTLGGTLGGAAGDLSEATVKIYDGGGTGGTPAVTASVEVNGSQWSYKAAHLDDGTYTAQVSQPDSAGNTGLSAPSTFVLDTSAPNVSIKSLGGPTQDTTPTLTGGLGGASGDIQSVTVKVFQGSGVGGTLQASGSASISGASWSYTAATLAPGTYTAEAVQSDAAGNTGTSSAMTFTIDTSAPLVTLNAVSVLSNDATPTLAGGAGTDDGDVASVLVRVYHGSAPEGSVAVEHFVTPVAGSWAYTTTTLSDGTYTAQAYQADEAGNKAASAARTFVVDTEAPAVKILSPANESTLHVARPTFAGLGGEAGSEAAGDERTVTLKIYEGASASGSPEMLSLPVTGGKWTTGSSGPQLPSGFHTAVVEQSDHAGNTRTSTSTFFVATNSPTVTLSASGLVKRGAAWLSGSAPSFKGTAGSEPEDEGVTLGIYPGTSAAGPPLKSLEASLSEGSWSAGPVPALADGTYTAQAQQRNQSLPTGYSQALVFTVDADAPHVTLSSPANGSTTTGSSQAVSGAAGTAPGDSPTVTAQLFSGSEVGSQSPLESITVTASSGSWSTAFGGLSPGTYTARAQQSDDVGNVGTSAPVSFTVAGPGPPPGPPSASFRWFPSAPQVGEPVSLVSTSTDAGAPITSYAWSLLPTGPLVPGAAVLSTTFATPGAHVVRLGVTDAAGLSSTVSETVTVAPRVISLIQPFPVVRIAGSESSRGVRIRLFSVQTPAGSRISVRCRGRGCPAHAAQSFVASTKGTHKAGTVVVVLKRFQRSLRPGAVLEVKVSRAGLIGKYTRFAVRRGKLPLRQDRCLSASGEKPMECPS